MKRYVLDFFLGAAFFWIVLGGCTKGTLSPDGVYQGNKFLYDSDQNLKDSKQSLGEFVDWTRSHYVWLHVNGRDDVIAAADSVRTNAPLWYSNAWALRWSYTNALYGGSSLATIASVSNAFRAAVTTIQTIRAQNVVLTNVVPTHE